MPNKYKTLRDRLLHHGARLMIFAHHNSDSNVNAIYRLLDVYQKEGVVMLKVNYLVSKEGKKGECEVELGSHLDDVVATEDDLKKF